MPVTKPFSRRDFLRTGAVLGGAVLLGPVTRFISPAHASLSSVPVVDRLDVHVAVDAYYDLLAADEERPALDVKRTRGPVHAQHGLALFLESRRGSESRHVMLDFGWTPDALVHNLNLMGLDAANLTDALVVSHGHADHFGGLMKFVELQPEGKRRGMPLYLGGDDALCHRWSRRPDGSRREFGVLDRPGLEAAGIDVTVAPGGAVVAGHGFTSGVIERSSPEEVLGNTLVEVGERDGVGCSGEQHHAHFSEEELKGNFLFDHHWGEHVTAYHVKDRGLVVMTSCGHAGLVNSVRQAQAASGIDKVHAVMGGFHLAPAKSDYVEKIIDLLVAEADPDYIVPMHCSGANFSNLMARKYPERLVNSYVGTRYIFGTA
jgi:7,8-dihydropterin-6-yl-methyl-4-(beta-D-ribofuranosyl)aminobenzene 5'-phosphate synthase